MVHKPLALQVLRRCTVFLLGLGNLTNVPSRVPKTILVLGLTAIIID
jgi:hypothetical protein